MANDVAVITGASGGIGLAVARTLADHGYGIGLLDLDGERVAALALDIEDAGGAAWAGAVDVCDAASVESALDGIEARLGPLSAAVTAAGTISKSPFLELEPDAWRRTLDVNLTGSWLVLQRVARRMVAAERTGAMVAISSVAGRAGRPTAADYAASKAGVISLVRSSALALAPHGIRVNAVCPGVVETPMTRSIHEQTARELGISVEDSIERMVAEIPLGRIETAQEVADAVVYLLSPQASFVTGQALNVCGGIEMD